MNLDTKKQLNGEYEEKILLMMPNCECTACKGTLAHLKATLGEKKFESINSRRMSRIFDRFKKDKRNNF